MSEPLRVLFYEDPLTDHHAFGWRVPHVVHDAPWLNALVASGVDARMLVHDLFAQTARDAGVAAHRLFMTRESGVQAALLDPQLPVNTLFHRFYGALTDIEAEREQGPDYQRALALRKRLASIVASTLGDFAPEIIVTWAPAPHLRQLFPSALILHKETGLYARAPFPTSYMLDPLGFHRWSTPRRHGFRSAQTSRQAMADLRPTLDRMVHAGESWPEFERIRSRFAGTVYAPAQMNGGFLFDAACAYRSQVHLILDVLERTPRDWLVVANDHPDCTTLTTWELNYIRSRHDNFLYHSGAGPIGQYLVRCADVTATVSSSLGLQALLWNKGLIALGDSHIGAFTSHGLADLCNIEAGRRDGDDATAWLSFHYCFPNLMMGGPGVLASYLKNRLEHWRTHGAATYFDEPWTDPAAIAGHIARVVEADARRRFGSGDSHVEPKQWTLTLDRREPFGTGWSAVEAAPTGFFQWIDGLTADLTLHLTPNRAHRLTCDVITRDGTPGQIASVYEGDTLLGARQVAHQAPTVLSVELPASPHGLRHVQFRATRFNRPDWESRDLSLLVGPIAIVQQPLAAPNVSVERARPRHSIVLPVLNGVEPLATTLPKMMAGLPDDCEVVVSDNRSDDGTWEFLHAIDDPRLTIVRTETRVDYATNAETGYRAASGVWLSHIGDDDLVIPSRFALTEKIGTVDDVDMIFAGRLRYYWPGFTNPELGNSFDTATFGRTILLQDGPTTARRLVNSSNIRHTGAVILKADLVERVRTMHGCFMPPRLGEYVGYRVAAGQARQVAFANQPVVIIGRHNKSIGTALFHPETEETKFGRSLDREIGRIHAGTGFDYLGFMAFSFEAALQAAKLLEPHVADLVVDYRSWRERLVKDVGAAVGLGRLSGAAAQRIVEDGSAHLAPMIDQQPPGTLAFGTPIPQESRYWGWIERQHGAALGIASIADLLDWLERTHGPALSPDELTIADVAAIPTSWVDA